MKRTVLSLIMIVALSMFAGGCKTTPTTKATEAADSEAVKAKADYEYRRNNLNQEQMDRAKALLDELLQEDGTMVQLPQPAEHSKYHARYWPIIKKYTEKYKLKNSLVLGIIHAESAFNPRAISIPIKRKTYTTHAYGLMQIVPELQGSTVYRLMNEKDGKPTPEQLYDPEFNINYGTFFIRHLQTSSICSSLSDPGKVEDCVIVSYNAGTRPFQNAKKSGADIDSMTRSEFQTLLLKHAPNNYLTMVHERMANWTDFDKL